MSTLEAAPESVHDDHGHGHDHPPFLAHHFDTPEQQYDSGKLGIWLFLVTEILFFSGMFVAYAIFRVLRPDVFEGCSQFLNTRLGAINTGVLLFSSLTMAWAVRCAQTNEHKGLTGMLAATLSCAMVFLGVKAIEYSHKWGMGLLPAGLYFFDPNAPAHHGGPNLWEVLCPPGRLLYTWWTEHPDPAYLAWICLPFWFLLVGVVLWLAVSVAVSDKFHTAVAMPLTVVCLSFFAGVGLGMILERGGEESHDSEVHAAATDDSHNGHGEVAAVDHAEHHAHASDAETAPSAAGGTLNPGTALLQHLAADATNSGVQSQLSASERQTDLAGVSVVTSSEQVAGPIRTVQENVMTKRKAGVFFSIYYCMTGVHAIHIIGGIGFLVWLLVRSVRQDFCPQYFGPVDYVGLYWHLVDLIWIYLFPLLYLIR